MGGQSGSLPRDTVETKGSIKELAFHRTPDRMKEQQILTAQDTRSACVVLPSIISKGKAKESKAKELYFLGCQGSQRPSVYKKQRIIRLREMDGISTL